MANPEIDNYCKPQIEADLYEATQRLRKAEEILERLGYRRCDIAACNCGGYHYAHCTCEIYESCPICRNEKLPTK